MPALMAQECSTTSSLRVWMTEKIKIMKHSFYGWMAVPAVLLFWVSHRKLDHGYFSAATQTFKAIWNIHGTKMPAYYFWRHLAVSDSAPTQILIINIAILKLLQILSTPSNSSFQFSLPFKQIPSSSPVKVTLECTFPILPLQLLPATKWILKTVLTC